MNEIIKVFKSEEFGSVRTVLIDGEMWFVGKDVAEILGYSNINKAIQMHVDEEDKKVLDFKGFSHFGNTLYHSIKLNVQQYEKRAKQRKQSKILQT